MAGAAGVDDKLLKEEARIRLKREQNLARKNRFLNARTRIMGVDVEGLDAQVEAKRRQDQDSRDEDAIERLKQMEIARVLEASKQEENDMREYQKALLKQSWDDAAEEHERIKNIPETYLDPLKAGPSAAQCFAGSDPNREVRLTAQKQQMRRWIQEQLHEKGEIQQKSDDGDIAYSQMLKAVEEIRDAADKEEKEMKVYLNSQIKDANNALIMAKNQRALDDTREWDSLSKAEQVAAASINLRDNEDIAMDDNGRIVRRDAFRGYSQSQIRRIIQENEDLLELKRRNDTSEATANDVWVKQKKLQQQAMEQAHYDEKMMRESETQLNLEVLKQQIALQQQRRGKSKKDNFGSISAGFFDQFGQSCR